MHINIYVCIYIYIYRAQAFRHVFGGRLLGVSAASKQAAWHNGTIGINMCYTDTYYVYAQAGQAEQAARPTVARRPAGPVFLRIVSSMTCTRGPGPVEKIAATGP